MNEQWIKFDDEHQPKEDDLYMVFVPTLDKEKPYKGTAWWSIKNERWELLPESFADNVTHWMPLPDDPK